MGGAKRFCFMVAAAGIFSLNLVAGATAAPAAPPAGGACSEDRIKFCKDVQPGAGRIAKCLLEHQNELSAPCKERLNKAKSIVSVKRACKTDAATFCKDVKPGGGRLLACLKEHRDDLSEACVERLDALKESKPPVGKK